MAQVGPSFRIGDSERAAAREALNVHLNAGRLGVEDYSERSARATDATTAAELADLFTDLPAPRPKLPGIRQAPDGWRLAAIAAGAVVVLVVGVVWIAVGQGGGQSSSSGRTSTAAVTAAPATSAVTALPTDTAVTGSATSTAADSSGAPTASVVPAGTVTTRHHGPLTLVQGANAVDLDAPQSDPQWAENDENATGDIVVSYGPSLEFRNSTRHLLLPGQADYAACSSANGYTSSDVSFRNLSAGQYLCFLTSDRRYAAARIVQIGNERITLDVFAYDPPIAG